MLNKNYPLSDSEMIYDYTKHRYILTNDYVLNVLGIDLQAKMGGARAINAASAINVLLDVRVSMRIYSLIYSHNDKQLVEYVLAKSPSAREMLKNAMGTQLLHLVTYGENEKQWLSKEAYDVLLTPIEETKKSVMYRWYRNILQYIPDYAEGGY